MNNTQPGALDGVRVIDVGLLVQGPQAAQMLYELGADVIKVEQPQIGDQARWVPLATDDFRAPYFIGCNRGKRSITLDLRIAAGREQFFELVDAADVVISNFALGTMADWGVGYEALAERNRRIIFAAGTAYGTLGPSAHHKGADLGGQAAGGLMRATAQGDTEPAPVGVTIADHIASQNLVSGILAALYARERTGQGQMIETSLLGGQIYAQASEFTAASLAGHDLDPPRHGGHPLIPGIYGVVPTADGALGLVGILPRLRAEFFEQIGAPELADDERFGATLLIGEAQDNLFEAMAPHFRQHTTAEWIEKFAGTEFRYAPVRGRLEVTEDPSAYDNDFLYRIDHPEWGDVAMVGNPIRLSDTPVRRGGEVPELGQHTEEILLELGRGWDEIAALREAGAI
jgi:crotonobetainyl-CoA:carnitine CoA-transferase CaiB-like acyl-CoA transferase